MNTPISSMNPWQRWLWRAAALSAICFNLWMISDGRWHYLWTVGLVGAQYAAMSPEVRRSIFFLKPSKPQR